MKTSYKDVTKENVFLLDMICFEYLFLEFKELIDWSYAPEDEFLQKRTRAIEARHKLAEFLQDDNFDYKGNKHDNDF